jgi:hypothetical protein
MRGEVLGVVPMSIVFLVYVRSCVYIVTPTSILQDLYLVSVILKQAINRAPTTAFEISPVAEKCATPSPNHPAPLLPKFKILKH